MDNDHIKPEKITKPIQLLGAWLAGLIIVNGSFLGTAAAISNPGWVVGTLVIASIINVPLFLGCIFLLQTKFRPEMQEDSYYAKYLESSTGKFVYEGKNELVVTEVKEIIEASNKLNISMLSGLDDGLKKVAAQVKDLSQVAGQSGTSRDKIKELEQSIEKTSKTIESAQRRFRSTKRPNGIAVNDLLPNYENVINDLANNGLVVTSTFGSTSSEPEVPKKMVLGFGRNIELGLLRQISKIAKNNGFDYIHFAEKDVNANNVYLGSYIYQAEGKPREVKFTDAIYDLIMNEDSDISDVIGVIENNRS